MAAFAYQDRAHYQRQRERALSYLGDKCVDCAATQDLQFDHRIAKTKSFEVAKNLNRRWEVLVVELDKCDLRCRSCHLKKTSKNKEGGGGWNRGLRKSPSNAWTSDEVHGTAAAYCSGCRCDPCRSAAALAKGRPEPVKPFVAMNRRIHGTPSMYSYHKCRCDVCKEGNRLRTRALRASKKKTSP